MNVQIQHKHTLQTINYFCRNIRHRYLIGSVIIKSVNYADGDLNSLSALQSLNQDFVM